MLKVADQNMLTSNILISGVLLLLLCTPLGFARLFTIVGELVVSPISARNLDEEYLTLAYEEDCLKQKVAIYQQKDTNYNANGTKTIYEKISTSNL